MPKTKVTQEQINFIVANCKKYTAGEMADILYKKFPDCPKISRPTFYHYERKYGIKFLHKESKLKRMIKKAKEEL